MQATDGNFYGTATYGANPACTAGLDGCGTVFRLTGPPPSTTSVTSSPNPSTFGELVTITATVGPAGPPTPTGTVGFTSNGTAISGCTAVPLTSLYRGLHDFDPGGGDGCDRRYLFGRYKLFRQQRHAVAAREPVPWRCNSSPYALPPGGHSQCRTVPSAGRRFRWHIQSAASRSRRAVTRATFRPAAVAYSLNVSVVPQARWAFLTIWPTGEGQPIVSTLNSLDGRIKANAAIVPAGTNGSVNVYRHQHDQCRARHRRLLRARTGSTLAFYPLTPCRVADTRNANGHLWAVRICTANRARLPGAGEHLRHPEHCERIR